ncbi:MAG: hypothetical protein V1866_04055 [archaeon]
MIGYFVSLLIVFLGVFVGLLVGYFTKEELVPGRKYFEMLKDLLFIAILIVFFAKNWSVVFVLLIALLVIIFSFSKEREALYYLSLAPMLFLAWLYNGFAIMAPLAFLYGFPIGTLYLFEHIKEKPIKQVYGLIHRHSGFVVLGVLLGIIGLIL